MCVQGQITLRYQLPNAFVHGSAHGRRDVQGAFTLNHRQRDDTIGKPMQDVVWEAGGFLAEYKMIAS